MKTNRIIFAAAIAAAALSCQKENQVVTGNQALDHEPMTISTGAATKTSLQGTDIHWTDDDAIAVFDNNNVKNEFHIENVNGSSADFSGNVTAGTTQIYAVYPYTLAASAQGSDLKVNVPADQTSKAGSFAEEHNISVAKAVKTPGIEEVGSVAFHNVCALLKFTVPAYISDVQKVTVSSNTVMAGEMTIDYSGDAPVCNIAEDGSKSISMKGSYESGSTFWFVLAPVTLDGITVNVETAKGAYSMSTDSQFEMSAGEYRTLGTLNLEKVSMTGASAKHVYNSSSILTGTDVTVNLGISDVTAAYVTNLYLEIKNAEGTVVRKLSKSSACASETIKADSAWPYLPKGDYTMAGSYTLSEKETKTLDGISFSITEDPEFSVTPGAYSSYTKYQDGDSASANSCQAETIYAVNTVAVGISDAILKSTNYSNILSQTTYALDGNTATENVAAGQTWGSHIVTATLLFDGVERTGQKDCFITGLPYTLNTAANDSEHKWQEEGYVNWNTDGGVRLGYYQWGGEAYIMKTFDIPSDINIQVTGNGIVNGTGSWIKVDNTISISVSDNVILSKTQKGNKETDFNCNTTAAIKANNGKVKINSSYNLESAKVVIKDFTISYSTK